MTGCRLPARHPSGERLSAAPVPVRFFDYVNKTWMNGKPPVNIEIAEGAQNTSAGLTFLQMGREGWGYPKKSERRRGYSATGADQQCLSSLWLACRCARSREIAL